MKVDVGLGLISALALQGCGSTGSLLVFGQTETYGVTLNGSTTSQGAELTLGYRSYDIAVVPTTTQPGAGGTPAALTACTSDGTSDTKDALSVIGQFNANNGAGTSLTASLGNFFATGQAAKRLSDGFAHQLQGPTSGTVSTGSTSTGSTSTGSTSSGSTTPGSPSC